MEPVVKIFSGSGHPELAKKIAESYGQPLGKVMSFALVTGSLNLRLKRLFAVVLYFLYKVPTHLLTISLNCY